LVPAFVSPAIFCCCDTQRRAPVNRASSVIYGNLLLVIIAAPAALKVLPHISRFDAAGIVYLGVVQIGIAYTLFTLAMARGVRSLDAGIVGYVEPVLIQFGFFLAIESAQPRGPFSAGPLLSRQLSVTCCWRRAVANEQMLLLERMLSADYADFTDSKQQSL